MGKKYELMDETIVVNGRTLHRIKSLRDIEGTLVRKGDLGGFIEKEENLSHKGNCWIYNDTCVYGDARVYGDANIKSLDDLCYISSFGSRNGHTTFFKCEDNTIKVVCGCFKGTLDEFRDKVKETHGDNQYAKEFLAIADVVELRLNRKNEVE